VPVALFVALLVLTVVYALLQLIVVGVLPEPSLSSRPLADAARVMMGPAGAAFVSIGALLSVYGYISANMLTAPRGLFALAERGDFPAPLAVVHPRFRTPHGAIVAFALLLWAFSQFAGFTWNLTLSAVSRLLFYGAVCAAVPVLRRAQPGAAQWRVPGGLLLPVLGVILCALLLTRVDFSESLILIATVAAASINWLVVRGRGRTLEGRPTPSGRGRY
jgi:amino acid transporter